MSWLSSLCFYGWFYVKNAGQSLCRSQVTCLMKRSMDCKSSCVCIWKFPCIDHWSVPTQFTSNRKLKELNVKDKMFHYQLVCPVLTVRSLGQGLWWWFWKQPRGFTHIPYQYKSIEGRCLNSLDCFKESQPVPFQQISHCPRRTAGIGVIIPVRFW